MIENVRLWFNELQDKLEMYQFNALQNVAPIQWPLIVKLIKQCETDENKIQMYSKQIDVIRKMMFQYDEIIDMQNAVLAKLERKSDAKPDSQLDSKPDSEPVSKPGSQPDTEPDSDSVIIIE